MSKWPESPQKEIPEGAFGKEPLCALYKSPEKWTQSQRERAETMFREYPDLERAYRLAQHLRTIFNKRSQKSAARLNLARCYNEEEDAGFDSFQTLAGTITERYDEVLNYFNERSTNANAEAFNSKVKNYRAALRGVSDVRFPGKRHFWRGPIPLDIRLPRIPIAKIQKNLNLS